ncbi:MAG: GNAT family N-acetyltransferase [Burkholderiaceae bacterium]
MSTHAPSAPSAQEPILRDSTDADLPAIQAIYAHHVRTGTGSFELDPPSLEEMTARRQDVLRNGFAYLVAQIDDEVVGYAYVNYFRTRPAYRNTVENSIYVRDDQRGRGIGRRLLMRLLERCEAAGLRQVLAVIGDSANTGSIALHASCGFRFAGTLRATGWKFDRWLDTVLMQHELGQADRAAPVRGEPGVPQGVTPTGGASGDEFAVDFIADYAAARDHFLTLAAGRGARLNSVPHPRERGRQGEALAIDTAVFGPADARHVLLIQGGTHGMEGLCGSGILCALLRTGFDRIERATQAGIKVVLLHALNPWGFSWCRRVNEDNIDLNRNFRDFSRPAAPDPDYALAHPLLFPESWPPDETHLARLQALIAERGEAWWQYAVSHGQQTHPEGMFHAGNAPTWSNQVLRQIVRNEARGAASLHWIDLHTGLGPSGHGEKIYGGLEDAVCLRRARECWGQDVTSTFEGNSTSAVIFGMLGQVAWDECPDTEYSGIALEYGTVPFTQVLQALQFDHWVHVRAPGDPALRARARDGMKAAFAVDTPLWRRQVTLQAWQAVDQAIAHIRR